MCGKCNLALFEVYALREEGDNLRFIIRNVAFISIHALREEGDA